jgi:steroid delta-isomerase-like uncharacterized protein
MAHTQDQNKMLARRFVDEVFNAGNREAYDQLVADDYVNHNPPVPGVPGTKEGFWQVVTATRAAFPDVRVVPEDMLAEADRVMFRDSVSATHLGAFQGIEATGKRLAWTEMHFFRVGDGRIAEHWANFDQLKILIEMGGLPGAGSATPERLT